MAEQIRKTKATPVSTQEAEEIVETDSARAKEIQEHGADVVDDMDAILDEIDSVLEVNAEIFVREYVQKGGE